ncbi:MAG: putative Ig domain-containing protein [Blastomonas sp.]
MFGFHASNATIARLRLILFGIVALITCTAAAAADLQVSDYSVDPDPIADTAEATFTVTVANNSAQPVDDPVVTIAIPANFDVINAPGNFPSFCALSGASGNQTLTCTLPQLVRDNPQSFDFTAVASNPGAANSTASIAAAGNTDNNSGNDSITITPTVRGGADLRLSKSGSAPSVIAGGQLTYTLTLTNDGPSTTSAVRVIDNLPAASDFVFQSANGSGWNCGRTGRVVTCNYSGAAPAIGAPYPPINITGEIASASAGTITNIATAELTDALLLDPDGNNNNSNTVVTNIEAGSDLQAVKSMPSTITVGSNATIVLTIRNTGPQNVPAGATIVDVIDSSLQIDSVPAGCSVSGQTVTCTGGSLNSTAQTNFNVQVTAVSPTSGTINNTADVTPPAGFADPDLGNNTVNAPFEVVAPNADLELRSKSKTPNPVAPGDNVNSRITIRNLGPSVASYTPATPIRFTDTLSADETFVGVVESGIWSCSAVGNVVTCATTGTGTLNVGSQLVVNLTTTAGAGTDTTITNTACTDRTGGSGHTPSSAISPTGNDCRSAGTRASTAFADLTVAKDVSLSPTSGFAENITISDTDQVFYVRLQVSNAAGGDTARTVRVTDALPNFINGNGFTTSVTQESATAGSLSYNSNNGLATWTVSNLAGGATETIVLRVERPFESGSFTNFASVFSPDTNELDTNNNTDSAQYSTVGIADMTINSKSVTPNPARVGVQSTYIISVRNDGANPAENVVVTDVIDPTRYLIVGNATTTKPGGTCTTNVGSGTVECSLGTFIRTETRQVRVDVMPLFPFGGNDLSTLPVQHVNQATVTTTTRDANGGTDPQAGNNFFNLDHTVNAPTFDLSVSKQESNPATDDPVRFDETLNYDIRVSNFGPSRATDVVMTDIPNPPAGLTMTLDTVTVNPVAANGGLALQAAPNAGCNDLGGTIECRIDNTDPSLNNLAAGSQVIFRLTFTMGGTPPSGIVTFTNGVEVTSAEQPTSTGPGADVQTVNNSASQNTTVLPSTDLEVVSKTRQGALERSVNEPVEFVIRFRNNGPSTATSVTITDVLPAGFEYTATPAPSTAIPGGSAASVSALNCSGTSTIACDVTGTFPAGAANTVDLSVYARAVAPYSGPVAPTDLQDTATIAPGVDAFGDPLSEDPVDGNNSDTEVVQITPSSISGSVYADDNDNNVFEGGEGMGGVTLTLAGTDAFGNAVSFTTTTDASGNFTFDNVPPSDGNGYTLVETQVLTHYDLNETAGTSGGTVDNSAFGDDAAQNTIAGIVLAPSTVATGYLFQNHTNAVINAVNDNVATVNSADGRDDAINAFDNDTFNGAPVDPADIVATITAPASNPGVTMDPVTGLVDIAPGTPADTYTIDYEICDAVDPTNCASATVTVEVVAPPIAAVNDTANGINGLPGQADVLNVLDGDTLNGVAVDIADVTITVASGSSVPAGLSFDPATGLVSVDPGTPAGTYSFDYTICEDLNPTNCATATATVTVIAAPIQAVDDSATGINGLTGQTDVLNVLDGDTLNGSPADIADVTITVATGSSVPAGLTFDPATGSVSVDPGTPAGTYSFDYTICEDLNPTNCSTATATVTVEPAVIDAVDDSVGGINGSDGATDVLNALDGDTLNGVAVTTAEVTISLAPGATVPAGLTFDPATGNTSVQPGTPAGTYSFDYQICEILNPANCAIATETVTVVAAPIVAVDDTETGINGLTGQANVLSVLGDDTLNGAPAGTSNVTITVASGSSVPAGLSFDPATGNVSVDPNTPAGTYSFDYTICENLNPANCATATATVTVIAAPIQAVDDSASGINGASGAADVLNVLGDDTLNGSPVNGADVTISVATGSSVPAGLSFDPATGSVSVDPGTAAGTYSFDYTICENLNPTNCSTATATVTVIAAPIDAADDSVAGINGFSGQTNVLNALDGDTLNGAPATTATVTISLAPGATVPTGLTFDPATGNTSVQPGTPAGTYSFDYQICEILNPANCAIATETVTVVAAPIQAIDDSASGINGASGAADVLNVLGDDTLNGSAVNGADVTITVASGSSVPAGLSFDPATGNVSVDPGTPAGTYSFDYTICENLNPANCSTATATVTVDAAPIVAVDDTRGNVNGLTGEANVLNALSDDTLNGSAATTSTVTISLAPGASVPAGLTFDPATGNVSVEPNTPAGTYSFDYQICEILNPANCAIATETVTVVAAPILAVDDSVSGINGSIGAANVLNVLGDDTLNGSPVDGTEVTITVAAGSSVPAGLSFDPATGNISVDPGTPAGTYSFDYTICEDLNPANCSTATATVTVVAGPITADDDNAAPVNGASGATGVIDAVEGDALNNTQTDLTEVTLTVLAPATPINGAPVPVLNPTTGLVDVPAGTPAGTYAIDYQICENLNPTNCATATVTVPVEAAPIVAVDDSVADVNGASGANDVLNALADDTLNGAPATLANVTIALAPGATVPAGLSFDPATGNTSVLPGTPAGTYSFDYQICEILNPTNCAIATETVTVVAAPIVAIDDSASDINGASGAADVLNVLGDDTLNGSPADTANVTIAVATGSSVPAGLTFNPATGSVSVDPGTPAGTYSFDYTICENLNPGNCSIATATVTVVAAPIEAVDDSADGINGLDGAADVLNVLDGDTLNGAPATTATVTAAVAPGSSVPSGLTFDPATGSVSVDPNTPAGTYSFEYQICEILNPANCTTATATVTVEAAPIEANPDVAPPTNGSTGGNGVVDVLPNDTLNGDPVDLTTVDITVVTPATPVGGAPVPVLDPATGLVDVPAGTPAGDYVIEYQICEELNPSNCATSTVTVPVTAAPIEAVDDSADGINGLNGAADVLNVLDGDTLNGVPSTIDTVTITVAPGSNVPAGLTFDPATGNVSVDPNTPAGSYSFEYQICENLNPTNCATATATVTVDAAPIEATPDVSEPVNGGSGGNGVVDVLPNDTLNGTPVTLDSVDVSVVTPATPVGGAPVPVLDSATGLVDVPAGTPAGDYVIEYQICEELNPANCATSTVTIAVTAGPIEAVEDIATDINGADGQDNVLNVLDGDTLNGAPATIDTVTITVAPGSDVPAGLTFDPATGNVSVDPNTPAGDYSFDYQICEQLNPTNCTVSTVTVTVVPSPIEASDDTAIDIDSASGQDNVVNAFDGDTINGEPAGPDNAILSVAPDSSLPPGILFDTATGLVSVAPGTPDGVYSFDYQLCEALNPTNCTTATITLTVEPSLSAVNGIVYLDENLNRLFEGDEELQNGWLVEVVLNDEVVATTRTDADGFYSVEELLAGDGYEIRFRHPTSNVLFGVIEADELPAGGSLDNQNLPIDPSGVIYDAISRQPVAGAVVNLTDANGNPLPEVCYVDAAQLGQITGNDGYYRFDIVAGADAACPVGRTQYNIAVTAPNGYANPESTVIAAQDSPLNVAGLSDPAAVVPNADAPQMGQPTTYYLELLIGAGDANVVNNHIPLDPFTSREPLLVTKTSTMRTANVGDLVPYTITVNNTESADRASVDVVDILPPGFRYVPGSARVNDVPAEPVADNRELRWEDQFLRGNGTSVYSIIAVIGAGVTEGDRINTALARNGNTNAEISNRGQAVVSIVPSAIFDCAEIIGKVYDDFNGDGNQDEGEPGIPGARVATVNGQLITTDEFGRYHITCAAVPNAQIGSNFVLKLDERSIPAGYAPTTDNPQSIRLTRGKIVELNFGIQKHRVITVKLDANAFVPGAPALKAEHARSLRNLASLEEQRLVIQVTYSHGNGESEAMVRSRLASVREQLMATFRTEEWDGPEPTIETNMVRAAAPTMGGE